MTKAPTYALADFLDQVVDGYILADLRSMTDDFLGAQRPVMSWSTISVALPIGSS
jgi:hypothetical protein